MNAPTTYARQTASQSARINDDAIVVTEIADDQSGGIFDGVLRAYRHQGFDAGYVAARHEILASMRLAAADFIHVHALADADALRLLREFADHLDRSIATADERGHFVAGGLGI